MKPPFAIHVTEEGRRDLLRILEWSRHEFGQTAARRYEALLTQALLDISKDPRRPGSKARPELTRGAFSYHLNFSRKRSSSELGRVQQPRHYLIYKIQGSTVELLRVLHDSRDLVRHIRE